MKKFLPLSICVSLLAMNGYAQEDTTTIELNNLNITENRMQTPFSESARSIYVVSRQQLEQAPVQSLNEVLSYVPGVDIRQRGPAGVQADVSIRGGTFEQTLILINGIKMSDPQTGHHLMNLPLDIDNIERIEVLKGPGARIYGQNAFSGAINIITKVPAEPMAVISGYGGAFETFGGNVSVALPGESYGQYVAVSHDQSEGYRENADYKITNAFYQSYLQLEEGKVNFMGGYTQRAFGAQNFYTTAYEEYEEVNTLFLSADYELKKNNWTLQPRIYWRRNHDNFILVRSDPDFFNNLHTTHVGGAEVHSTYRSKLGLSGIGLEYRYEDINSTNLGERNRNTAGIFAEHRFYLFDRLDLTPGLYLNWYSDYGWNLFPGLDASYEINTKLKAFANIGRSFRIPTYTDLYYQGPDNIGNDQLEPEDAITYEGGFKYFSGDFWGQLSYFKRDASNLIDWVRSNDTQPWQPQNFYNVDIQGIEAGVNFDFSKNQTAWVKRVSINYTFLDAELLDTEGVESRYALDNLNHQLIFEVTHKIIGPVNHSLRMRYLDRATLSDYTLLDSRIFYKSEQFNIFAEATNITNTEYQEINNVPMPGRWFRAGVTFKLGLGKN
ncbi:TonB-dependent receptor [Catalinimonas niigatensis]|uniref:TonB-dependent receptor n=1 Tax=Catalinimonas niigatensis TaxID=1397264 RepID=UPI002665767F|nr:TonB-dependent receptor [Catalinimonas niigatensis]WPP52344.1 TonB-dependent receptor [Catalinimonas niigatensis]